MDKSLVCYFSATGTTKSVAEKISKIVDGDLFEIEPVEKYTSKDLDWTDNSSRTTMEKEDENFRPSVKDRVENMEEYDKIILGFPVWWYKEPNIIDTFIEENDFGSKKVYVFVTSGGSGYEESLESLRKRYSNINFVSGRRLNSFVNESEILSWIK